jgi:hypothetical protein
MLSTMPDFTMLFSLPASVAAILNSVVDQRQEMSGNVDSVISKSGLVESVRIAVEISSILQAASVCTAAIVDFR